MSKMSEIHQEITELGLYRVSMLESAILQMSHQYNIAFIETYLIEDQKISPEVAAYLTGTAKTRVCSNMLREENYRQAFGV